jgi:RNA polymerase sigma-70 factor (ECF subfamily)
MSARERPAPSRREFERFYAAHVGFVWRVLVRFGVDGEGTGDATQEVFVIAHRQFGAWEDRASPRSWLYGVARRVAAHQHRAADRRARKHAALERPPSEDPRARLEGRSRLRQILAVIEALAPERRAVYELAMIEELSPQEIAEALDCKLNTVYSRLRRARADVERALAQLDDSPQPAAEGAAAAERGRARHG